MEKVCIAIDISRENLDRLSQSELTLRTGQRRTYPSVITVGEPCEKLGRTLSEAVREYCELVKVHNKDFG